MKNQRQPMDAPDAHSAQPLVSIVLPTYNGARHLEDSIRSCLEQTYRWLELILVDDGSPDPETGKIIERQTDPRVRTVRLAENRGLPEALNAGFREAHGDLLTWTSDDNRYRPEAVETMVREIGRGGADFVYAQATVIDEEGKPAGRIVPRSPEWLPIDNCIGACFLYTARVAETIGPYDPDMVLTEDYDYWIRVSKRFRMRRIEADLYEYRKHATTLSSVHGRSRVEEMIDAARRKHFRAGEILAAEALRAYSRHDYPAARRLIARALARRPFDTRLYHPFAVSALPEPVVRCIVGIKKLFRQMLQ